MGKCHNECQGSGYSPDSFFAFLSVTCYHKYWLNNWHILIGKVRAVLRLNVPLFDGNELIYDQMKTFVQQ